MTCEVGDPHWVSDSPPLLMQGDGSQAFPCLCKPRSLDKHGGCARKRASQPLHLMGLALRVPRGPHLLCLDGPPPPAQDEVRDQAQRFPYTWSICAEGVWMCHSECRPSAAVSSGCS